MTAHNVIEWRAAIRAVNAPTGYTLLIGDALEQLKLLPDGCVDCCVTSPPYWGLRNYKTAGQIGQEPAPAAYVERLVEVFREVRRVLANAGTLWLNLGDTYARQAGDDSMRGTPSTGQARSMLAGADRSGLGNNRPPDGFKPKDLIGVPWRVAFALQADGWWLRQDIIWAKPNPMPESVTDRCTRAHEYLFLLAKSERYYFDHAAMQEPSVQPNRKRADRFGGNKYVEGVKHSNGYIFSGSETRNRRDVWTIPTRSYTGAHFATFPPELVQPCVLAGCPAGGLVLDPFAGTGTTALAANAEGRHALLIELNPDYATLIHQRCDRPADNRTPASNP